jgi:uncharacterized membrane protein YgaE (UPF0421/DUF939 family)
LTSDAFATRSQIVHPEEPFGRRTQRENFPALVGSLAGSSCIGIGCCVVIFLAERLLGHPQPVFAAISAIVCLSPGFPSHTKQTEGLLLGVATGIVIGELSLTLPDGIPLLRITLAAFFSVIVAASYGQPAVVPIQAGVSAILVLAFGPATTGSVRMADVAVGAAVGFVLSQVLSAVDQNRRTKADRSDQAPKRGECSRSCSHRSPQARAICRNPHTAAVRWIAYL